MSDWYLKLIIIAVSISFIGFLVLTDFRKNKRLFAYLLIALFAQTGFAYALEPGYETSAAELLYFGLLIIMGLDWLRNSDSVPDIGMKQPVLFYLLCSIVGVFTAIHLNVRPINIFIEVKSYVGYVFYLFLIPYLLKDRRDIHRTMWAFVILSVIPLGYVLPNLPKLSAVAESGPQMAQFGRTELTYSWGALNIFVGYIIPVIFIALTLIRITSVWAVKGFLILFMGASLYAVFFSQTRGGWISFLISFMVYCVLARIKVKVVLIFSILLVVLMFSGKQEAIKSIIGHRIMDQTIDAPDSSLEKRLERWEIAISTFRTHPFLGSGWGGYLAPSKNGRVGRSSYAALPRWHNSIFEILSQLGLPGIFGFCWLWLRIGKLSSCAWRLAMNFKDGAILSGLIAAVVSILIYSLGEQQFYRIQTASVSWFIAGLLLAYGRLANPNAA
jgi:O-antigen ligase